METNRMLALVLSVFVGQSLANPLSNVWLSPIGSFSPLRQFHMQDGAGGYHYSFTGPHHAKAESSLNGITQGGYSYVDANGILQTVSYTADDQNGFRVSASNLPQAPKHDFQSIQDTAEVAAAKKDHLDELRRAQSNQQSNYPSNILSYKILPSYYSFAQVNHDDQKGAEHLNQVQDIGSTKNPFLLSRSEVESIQVPKPDPSLNKLMNPSSTASSPLALTTSSASQVEPAKLLQPISTIQPLHRPIAVPTSYVVPVMPYRFLHSSLHHTQDSLGQYDYTYTGDSSAKTESRSLDGTTRGAYSYIDANGILQQVHYVADHNGFRVLATNLPEAK